MKEPTESVVERADWEQAVERIRYATDAVYGRIWPPPLGLGATPLDEKYLYATKPATINALLDERASLRSRIHDLEGVGEAVRAEGHGVVPAQSVGEDYRVWLACRICQALAEPSSESAAQQKSPRGTADDSGIGLMSPNRPRLDAAQEGKAE